MISIICELCEELCGKSFTVNEPIKMVVKEMNVLSNIHYLHNSYNIRHGFRYEQTLQNSLA